MAADSNGGPHAHLQDALEQIGKQDDELLSMRGEYMATCRGPRERIKEVKASLKEGGANMRAFAELLNKYRAQRAHEKRVSAMEADDADSLEEMKVALGDFMDLPLGAHAVAQAEGRQDNLTI